MQQIFYRAARWLLLAVLVGLGCYFFYIKIYRPYGDVNDLDARLPDLFHPNQTVFWLWFLGSSTAAGVAGTWTFRRYRSLRRQPLPGETEPEAVDPSLKTAWESIANLRRGLEDRPICLMIAEGDEALALIAAAGLGPDAVAPVDSAPIRALRTVEGFFLQCRNPVADSARFVARSLATPPGSSTLRGIVIQVPVETLSGPKSRAFGQSARDALRAMAESSPTRCPAYVVVSGMEGVPGFLEFARRRPPEYRVSARFGFSIPGGIAPSPDSIAREYDRLIDWCDRSVLDLMEAGPLLQESNESLFAFSRWFQRARGPMLNLLDIVMPGGDDPVEFLGCYFSANGSLPEDRAHVESLMRIKVFGDDQTTRWSRQTLAKDSGLRRAAIWLGAVGGGLAGLAWTLIFLSLRPEGWMAVLLASTVAVGWVVSGWLIFRGIWKARAGGS